MMHFDEWWNSAAADSFRAKHEDLDGEVFRTVWDAAQLGQAAIKKAEGTADDQGWSQSDMDTADALDGLLAEVSAPAAQGMDAADTARLNWLDAQVKNHAVHNGFLWQEGGWESDRGLVCAIQGKKQKKTVRQAIDAALAAKAKQGERP